MEVKMLHQFMLTVLDRQTKSPS